MSRASILQFFLQVLKREVKKGEEFKKKTVYCLVNKNKSQEVVICILTSQNLKQFYIAYAAHDAPATSLRKGFSIDPRFRIPQRFHACIRQGLWWPVPEVSRLGDGFAIRCASTVCLGWNLGYTYSGWSVLFDVPSVVILFPKIVCQIFEKFFYFTLESLSIPIYWNNYIANLFREYSKGVVCWIDNYNIKS